ncbi:MAG: right-handed parallel beta-helix repeat-containing protein [Thermoplasmata archaeon]|nr:MAG: right-handed parallel beta-helix repeat-containing protein [Thermoplasmata archaeon]
MEKRRKAKLSIMLCIVALAAMLVSSAFENVMEPISTNVSAEEPEPDFPLPPDESIPSEPEVEEYDFYLADSTATQATMHPEILFVNADTTLSFTFGNNGAGYVTDVNIEVYAVTFEFLDPEEGNLPEEPYIETATYLTTFAYGAVIPGEEVVATFTWTPITSGDYELRLGFSYKANDATIEYEDGVMFYVARDDIPVTEITEDWIVNEDTTITDEILILRGDLVVTDEATLTLENCYMVAPDVIVESGTLVYLDTSVNMGCTARGQWRIWVMHRGTLMVRGSTIHNGWPFNPANTYRFEVDGRLICSESPNTGTWSWIRNVWGQTDSGGIQLRNNNPAKQSMFRRTYVSDCDTVGIGCYGSSPTLWPYVAVFYCGSSWGTGTGIYVEGATANPLIQSSWILWNARNNNILGHGIKLYNAGAATIIGSIIYRNSWTGIYCYYSSQQVTIQSNSIYYNRYYNILCYYSPPTIDGNWIAYSYYGIMVYRGNPTIKYNTVERHTYHGILCYYTPSAIIDGYNIIRYNGYHGIYSYRSNPIIKRNSIHDNGFTGIYLSYSAGTIEANTIDNNGWTWVNDYGGIFGYYSTPTIKTNTIINNDGWGIWMRYGAPINKATIGTDNTFTPGNNRVGRVWQQWWLRVWVKSFSTGASVAGANVRIYQPGGSGVPYWSGVTGANGMTSMVTVTEFQINSGGTTVWFTPHRVVAWVTGWPSTTQWLTVDDNMITVVYVQP